MMKFAVLIACRSESETIGRTLSSISEANIPDELKKVVVIENGEEQKLESEVLAFQEKLPVEYLFIEKRGKSLALNIAIQNHIPDDYFILFTDDDVRVNPDWLVNYANAFKKYRRGHYFGAAFDVDYERDPDPDIKSLLPSSARGISDSFLESNLYMPFLGCNWAAHSTNLMQAGLFSLNHGPGSKTGATGQETNMQRKLKKMGVKRVLITENYVWHNVPVEKCSWNWIKNRAEKMGRQGYLSGEKTLWLLRKAKHISISLIKSFNGKRENRYRLAKYFKEVQGFIKAALSK